MGSTTFLILCLAVFPEAVDGLREEIALVGDRVVLDCVTNSSYPVNWRFRRAGSREEEVIPGNSSDISDSYRMVTKDFGHVALVIDNARTSLAGRYKCIEPHEDHSIVVNVIVLDPIPSCDERAGLSLKNIVCNFRYAGEVTPKLEWLKLLNTSWNASCIASNGVVDCSFINYCSGINPSPEATRPIHYDTAPSFEICSGNCTTCKWGVVSSSVGILQVNDQNRTIILGGWQCNPTEFSTTSPIQTSDDLGRILIPICAGVITTIMVLLLFIFIHKKHGWPVCRMKRQQPDVHFETAMEEELYEEIDKPKKEDAVQTQMGFIMEEIDEDLCGKVDKPSTEEPGYAKLNKPTEDLYGKVNKPRPAAALGPADSSAGRPSSDVSEPGPELPPRLYGDEFRINAELFTVEDNSLEAPTLNVAECISNVELFTEENDDQTTQSVSRHDFNTNTYESIDVL